MAITSDGAVWYGDYAGGMLGRFDPGTKKVEEWPLPGGAGEVAVTVAEVRGEAGPQVELQVRDSGQGMDAATAARVFAPFFTTREVGEGTGLGLSVVHGIVQSFGATISVHSELGKGSTFQVLFPLAAASSR